MNLLVRFVLRHAWAQTALAVAVAVAIWVRQPSLVLWLLGVFYGALTVLSLLAAWWVGAGVFAGALAASWWCVRGTVRAAAELERLVDGWRVGEAP